MNITKTHKIIFGVTITIAFLVYLLWSINKSNINNTLTNTEISTEENVIASSSGNYKIEQVPINEGKSVPQPVPDLDRKITVYNGAIVAPEARAYAETKIKSLQTGLKSNLSDVLAWIDLGIHQKNAGDYEGAILSWKYASRLSPTDYVSVGNLGNLYAYFIKDKTQAEFYHKQAITKGSTQSYLYIQLAEVYRDVFKDLDKARAIIEEGLKKIPSDPALLEAKKNLQ